MRNAPNEINNNLAGEFKTYTSGQIVQKKRVKRRSEYVCHFSFSGRTLLHGVS
jgi:hypothetical protein